jgi:hypothetical protein
VNNKVLVFARKITTLAVLVCPAFVSAEPVTHYYTVTVDYALSTLWVEARFRNPVSTVAARSRSAGRYLLDVRSCDDSTGIRKRGRRLQLPDAGIRCLNYTVDLDRAASEYRNNRSLADNNIVVSPSYWMWRPKLSDGTKIQAEFRLPEGMRVSVPWQQLDDNGTRFLLGKSPESASAPAVFGHFDYRELDVPGATLRVALLDGKQELNNEAATNWLMATATDISLAYGRFPNPSPQVVVVPVSSSRSTSPVPFGRVIRDGGETVELFVNPEQPLERFLEDWTATHEFSHLMHPYLQSDHHWITEGFAQYYQNVLLARAGAYEAREAWQKLYAGYERGRKSRPELSPNDAASGSSRGGRMKVYWSGAALALMADVSLRERSGGKQTLDTVMASFQTCCLPSDRMWTGQEFFTQLDTLAGEPVFMPLYRRYADTDGFPDTGPVFERLGLTVNDGTVRIGRSGELREIRDAITRTDSPTAQWRGQLSNY